MPQFLSKCRERLTILTTNYPNYPKLGGKKSNFYMLTYFIDQKLRQGSVETACLCSTVSGASANMKIQMTGPDFYPAEHCSHLEGASPMRQASGLGSSRGSTRAPTHGLCMWLELLSAWEWILRENIPRASVPRQKPHYYNDLTLEVTQWFAEVVTSPPRCRGRGHDLPPLNERKPKECAAI